MPVGEADLGAWLPGPAVRGTAGVPAPGMLATAGRPGTGADSSGTPGEEGGHCHDA
jgi:hypothetical protein